MRGKVFLYQSPHSEGDSGRLKEYLAGSFGVEVEVRGDIFSFASGEGELARKLAEARVVDVIKPFKKNDPLPMELRVEKDTLKGKRAPVILYDGFMLMLILKKLLPRKEVKAEYLHLYLTERLFGTFDEGDKRYHARAVVLGYPSIVSPTGIVEAPAKPREYYLERRLSPHATEMLREKYKERFIDYGDPRMQKALEGYTAMAVFYHFLGETFCENVHCRLYNSHWQEELINSQLSQPEFCPRHEKMRKKLAIF